MVIKRGKNKESHHQIKEESDYARMSREYDEKRAKEAARKKQKEIDAIEEEKRKAVIIRKYLTKLDIQIKEKNLYDFWTFPDRSGFKKIGKGFGYEQMQKLVQKDINKYANRQIMLYQIRLEHNESDTSTHRKYGTWLLVDTVVFKINSKGEFESDGGCHYVWRDEDFKLTKFSFKLLETIMHPITDHKLNCVSLMGYPLTNIIKRLEKLGIDFSDVLNPLAGI
jgi:hypothetical protein